MATKRGIHMTPMKQQVIDALEKNGGKLVPTGGATRLSPQVVSEALGIPIEGKSNGVLTSLLQRLEKDGLVRRTVSGKSTKAIYLVHGKNKTEKIATTDAKAKPGRKPGPKKSLTLPVPALGSTPTVFFTSMDEHGVISIGLRDESGSWSVNVTGYAKSTETGE